jgi:hypothetical protein
MRTARLFRRQPQVIWVPHLRAFVHTGLRLGVDGAAVEEDLALALAAGDVTGDEAGIAAFCAEYFDLAAGVFPVTLDARGRWHRTTG